MGWLLVAGDGIAAAGCEFGDLAGLRFRYTKNGIHYGRHAKSNSLISTVIRIAKIKDD
jgi:hypothetical protein